MGFSKLLTAREEELNERVEYKAELENQMLEIHNQLDRLRTGEGWEDLLLQEQRTAFTDMMSAEGDTIILARERARMLSRLLNRKKDLEADLDRLRSERNGLEE